MTENSYEPELCVYEKAMFMGQAIMKKLANHIVNT